MSKRPAESMPTENKKKSKWNEDSEYTKFNSKTKGDLKLLSNFWTGQITIFDLDSNPIKFWSGEAAFHYMKLDSALKHMQANSTRSNMAKKQAGLIQLEFDPLKAKRLGGKGKEGFKLTDTELKDWNEERAMEVQVEICLAKCAKHAAVKEALLNTKNKILIHQDNRAKLDTPWGAKIHAETGEMVGKNKLGKIWEEVRGTFVKIWQ